MTGTLIFVDFFILIGLSCIVFGIWTLAKAHSSRSWPSVIGIIQSSDIGSLGPRDKDTSYKPVIRYSYTVNGNDFSTSVICFGLESYSGSIDFAEGYVGKYPSGKRVDVFYNPFSPSIAVLEPGVSPRSFIPIQFGFMFVAAGVAFLMLYWHQESNRPNQTPERKLSVANSEMRKPSDEMMSSGR